MKTLGMRCWVLGVGFLLLPTPYSLLPAFAHDDDDRPKTPTKAAPLLQKARKAMDAYKTRLTKEGKYGCCMEKPVGSKVDGCDICAKTGGSCQCGANLAAGKGVCGECYGAWKVGKGSIKAFGKLDHKQIKIVASDHQQTEGVKPFDQPRPDSPDWEEYRQAMIAAKRTMLTEKRYVCCVGQGGCDECAQEGYCPCGKNLAKDLDAKPEQAKRGVCAQCLDGIHGGHVRVGDPQPETVALAPPDELMLGLLGNWSMNREGSGTSWLPDSSPLYARMNRWGRWQTMQMGLGFAAYTDAGGLRGDSQFFTPSRYMFMARRETGGGIVGLRGMVSADPLLIGGRGYPNLFQRGGTHLGMHLENRMHPHDLFMELAASYSVPIGGGAEGNRNRAFLYFAPVGEAPLGIAAFQHRPTAWDNPISPISRHWLEGTHITFGVATLGATFGDKWKLEAASFTGREPNENRYDFDAMRFDSFAGRVTFNPNRNWSLQTSYGFLKSPEALNPENHHRLTASAHFNRAWSNGTNVAATLGWGKNFMSDRSPDAWLLEASLIRGRWMAFGRWENVVHDEMMNGMMMGGERVSKFSIGGTYNFEQNRKAEQGIGFSVDFYRLPSAMAMDYGSNPVGFSVFYRLRFGRM